MKDSREVRNWKDAGGTSGGLGSFLIGFVMTVAGGWLVANQVVVTSGFWTIFGRQTFGLSLLPVLLGISILFFNGRSPWGWLLTLGGITIIIVGVIVNLQIFFRPDSLFNTLMMFGLLFAGLGLLARSLRPQQRAPERDS